MATILECRKCAAIRETTMNNSIDFGVYMLSLVFLFSNFAGVSLEIEIKLQRKVNLYIKGEK